MGDVGDLTQAGQVFGADGLGLSVEGLATVMHQGGRGNEQADASEAVSEELTLLGGMWPLSSEARWVIGATARRLLTVTPLLKM